jgi:uncharacterized membrane protein
VIYVDAPVAEVFAFWSNLESFPRFMAHVNEVRKINEDRYHFRVGAFEWEADVTAFEPNQVIAWRSVHDAAIENAGSVRFAAVPGGGTRVEVRLSYSPPAGMVGHGVAKLLGADPKKQMDDDLLRFKSLIEKGKATGHETVTRAELSPKSEPAK